MLTSKEIQVIRDHQLESIKNQALVKNQLELIYAKGWFNLWVPKSYGGNESTLTEGLDLLEELAYWDGGLAWTVTLCAGANMFAGYIQPQLARELFSKKDVCLGGSGRVGGKAIWDGKQYRVSGLWQYATGAPHLSHFTLNAEIYHHDRPQYKEDGTRLIYSFLVPREQVLIHYDWDTFGLESTASHSFSLEDVALPRHYAFQIMPNERLVELPLFRIPFTPFAELTLLVNYMGMYRRFLDLIEKYFFERSKDEVWRNSYSKSRFKLLDSHQLELKDMKEQVKLLVEQLWNKSVLNDIGQEDALVERIGVQSRAWVKDMRKKIVELFPLVGIAAAQKNHELNIVFRNIFTATQHSLLNTPPIGS